MLELLYTLLLLLQVQLRHFKVTKQAIYHDVTLHMIHLF